MTEGLKIQVYVPEFEKETVLAKIDLAESKYLRSPAHRRDRGDHFEFTVYEEMAYKFLLAALSFHLREYRDITIIDAQGNSTRDQQKKSA